MFRGQRSCILAILALLTGLPSAWAQDKGVASRFALVIGNAHYRSHPLPTALNDAGLVAETLSLAGFDVTAGADVDLANLHKLVDTFLGKVQAVAGPDMIAVVYLAGYGLQFDGDNFLVPVDAEIARDVDIPVEALRLSNLSRALEGTAGQARIFIDDLGRVPPFAKGGAPIASGLSPVEAAQGSLTAFNTAPGLVSAAENGTYGTYARTFAEMLDTPGLPTNLLFEQLRLRVTQITNGSAVPWDDSKLASAFALLAGPPTDLAAPAERPIGGLSPDVAFFLATAHDRLDIYLDYLAAFAGDPLEGRVATMTAARREALIWAAAVKVDAPAAYWTYMRRYRHGPHLFDARRRLAAVHAALEPPPRFDPFDFGELGRPTPDEVASLARYPLTLDDAGWVPLPPPPDGLIPPPRQDDLDVSLPPLAPPGSLPIPLPSRGLRKAGPGLIHQLFVPGYGEIQSRFLARPNGATEMDTTSAGTLVSRTEAQNGPGRHAVTQRDAKGAIVSRTVTTYGKDLATTVQTGPTGGILTKVVARTDPSGGRTLTVTNGNNQVIATIERDKNGVVIDIAHEAAPGSTGADAEPIATVVPPPPVPQVAPARGPAPPEDVAAPPPPPELEVEPAPVPVTPPPPLPPPKTVPGSPTPSPAAETAASPRAPSEQPPASSAPLPPPRPVLTQKPPNRIKRTGAGPRRPLRRARSRRR